MAQNSLDKRAPSNPEPARPADGDKLRILVLDEEFPYPVNTGKRTRSFNLYRRLSRIAEIRYVAYGDHDSDAVKCFRTEGLEPVPVTGQIPRKDGMAFYLRLLRNLVSPLPYIVTSHYTRRYELAVRSNVSEFDPHLIVCEWTPYSYYVRDIFDTQVLLSTHNIEADIWRRYFENESNPARKWYIGEQWRKVRRFEKECLNWVDAAIAVSSQDEEKLRQIRPDLRTLVVPNGVDLDYFTPLPHPAARNRLVFTGSMDWRPNQDAARHFAFEILPELRLLSPDVTCSFVGRSPPADIRSLADIHGIEITGTVDDVRPYVEKACLYIVPLRIGGGTRLKILEALAMGRAVVSTSIGAEGLELVDGKHIILADEPLSFARRVHELMQNPSRCKELGAEGRKLVERKYGWNALARTMEDFVKDVNTVPAARALKNRIERAN